MNEEQLAKIQEEKMVEDYFKTYKTQMNVFEKSIVAKAVGGLSEHHYIQLGKQLDQWKFYEAMHESNGSLNTLGELPKVALDVITATMSNSVLPVIASTQSIEQQKSIIWFKNVKALDSKGNMVAGDKFVDPRTGTKTPKGYSSNEVVGEIGATGDGTTTSFAISANGGQSIRSQFIKVYLAGGAIYAKDFEGKGILEGVGVHGTVDYATGAIALTFAVAPANAASIFVDYQQNYEEMTDVPRMSSFLDSTSIEAKAYALKSVMGMFQMFALKKAIGDSALDDMTLDLTREINAEVGGDMISKYVANAVGTTTFSKALPAGAAYSLKQYREGYSIGLADSESVMMGNVGRGAIKVMIVGRDHGAFVRGLDGFQSLSDGGSLGAHILGIYKGVTYVRVPEQALLDTNAGIGLYTGAGALESAGVYAPFMPLTIQNAPLGPNPLTQQTLGAHMAGTAVVVAGYATKFNLVP